MESHPGDTLGTRFLTFWGAIGAFFGFALFAILLQKCSSGVAKDPRDAVRAANLVEIREDGLATLAKMGWDADSAGAVEAAVASAKSRKQIETEFVVPGSATAARLAAEAAEANPPEASEEVDGGDKGGVEADSENSNSVPPAGETDSESSDDPPVAPDKPATDEPTQS